MRPAVCCDAGMDAAAWDARYADRELTWSAGPNALFAEVVADLPPGRALDVAAGEGRTALWLARRGWAVRAVDFSAVGLAKGRARAAEEGLAVEWVLADVTATDLGQRAFDLVAVLYLHLPEPAMRAVLRRCADPVAGGGRLVVIGHDRDNLARGHGGPQDPELLHTPELLRAAADAAGLVVRRAEQVLRPTDDGPAVDTLLVAERPAAGVPTAELTPGRHRPAGTGRSDH